MITLPFVYLINYNSNLLLLLWLLAAVDELLVLAAGQALAAAVCGGSSREVADASCVCCGCVSSGNLKSNNDTSLVVCIVCSELSSR